jgi:hypothetical protein
MESVTLCHVNAEKLQFNPIQARVLIVPPTGVSLSLESSTLVDSSSFIIYNLNGDIDVTWP